MLIQIKCQNCGSNINVDNNNHKYVCEHCGAEFILEETVNNFQTVNQYHTTQNIVKHVYGKDVMDATDFIQNADVFVSLGEFGKAEDLYNKAININPADWRGWFGIVKVKTLNFSKIEDKSHLEFLSKAKKVATKEQQLEIEGLYREFSLKVEKERRRKEELQREEYLRRQELLKQQKLVEERQKKKKKISIISIIIVLAVAIAVLIPIISHISEADLQARNGLKLEEKEDYYIVTGIERFNENIVIPSQYKGKDVKEFEEDAFSGNDNIKSITIPDSIIRIADGAFANCDNLTSVNIGNGVTRIENAAFNSCPSLTNVSIGNGLTYIGSAVFVGCESLKYNEYENFYYLGNNDNPYMCLMKAKDVNIANCIVNEKTKFICEGAFSSCVFLESITFGKSIATIDLNLGYMGDIKNIYFLGELADWLSIDGLSGIMEDSSSKNLYINGQILTDVVISDTITSIPSHAFYGTTIKNLTIGDSVTRISQYAFHNCNSLEHITFNSLGEWVVSSVYANGATIISSYILEDLDTIKYFLTSKYSSYSWTRRLDT